jgi:alpha-galactosidase
MDLDVTAGLRPGYFGAIFTGPLFVENRYTDWHRYWPHHTLRNLWMLSKYIDPVRLRMELLNNTRRTELYENDPLAPVVYDPAYLFASVMFASPLGWFEVSNLPEKYVASIAPIVKVWREHREAIHTGQILPIGEAPSGASWTGFASNAKNGNVYAVVFRELTNRNKAMLDVPFVSGNEYIKLLGGTGDVAAMDGKIEVTLEKPLSYIFIKLSSA